MHETVSLWLASTDTPSFADFQEGMHADVAVIGAGITGLTAAVLLKERGKKVALLEKDKVASGESGFTTAHITEAVDAGYHHIARSYSKDAAKTVASASRATIDQIEALIGRYSINCRFRRLPAFIYTEKRNKVAMLKNEAASAREAGLDTSWTTDVPLPFETRGAVRFENQAQFHPREYFLGLAAQVADSIYEGVHVRSVEHGQPCVIETSRGKMTADHVFIATNAPINDVLTHVRVAPYRTYAIATPAGDDHPDGMFWDTADPYHYTRWQDTDAGTFMIVGGEDHKVGQEEDTESCFSRLEQFTNEHFGPQEVRFRWSGQIIESNDGLPFIGPTTKSGRIYISTGYAGQGMTFGTLGAMIVADHITEVANPYAELFDSHRVHLRGSVTDYVTENLDFPKHLVLDRLTKWNSEGDALVAPGDGKIVTIEGTKVALHRDEGGQLHALSPVCTHMKCDVAWNNVERTWDCPCHGSRFGIDGGVVNGPATAPLKKVDI